MIGGFSLLSESKRKWGNVPEDSSKYSEEKGEIYLAVADGVSRDPFNNYPDLNTEDGKKLMAKNYPLPSIAKKVADIAVNSRDLYLANKKIKAFNKKEFPDPDWLKNDFAGCTASLVKIKENKLGYQFIACCGIGVIDKNGRIKLQTPDEYWTNTKDRWDLVKKADFVQGFLDSVGKEHDWWRYPEGRIIMRRMFRNKPSQKFSFGVLTGEKEAEEYIRLGKIILDKEDVVLVYTDGLRNALFSKDGLQLIGKKDFSGLEKYCKNKVESEGTVVYWCK